MMFKKLNEQIQVHRVREFEVSLEERYQTEIGIIFGTLLESLEAGQDIIAMYGVNEDLFNKIIPNNKEMKDHLKKEHEAATVTKVKENKKKVEQLRLDLEKKEGV